MYIGKNVYIKKLTPGFAPLISWFEVSRSADRATEVSKKFIKKRVFIHRDHSSITSSKRWVGGVSKWQFLMIYSTVNHQRGGSVGLKKSKT